MKGVYGDVMEMLDVARWLVNRNSMLIHASQW